MKSIRRYEKEQIKDIKRLYEGDAIMSASLYMNYLALFIFVIFGAVYLANYINIFSWIICISILITLLATILNLRKLLKYYRNIK